MKRKILTCSLFYLLSISFYALADSSIFAPYLRSPLPEMQTLRAQGQLDKAIDLGLNYLNAQPGNLDTDVMLVTGLMLLQKKDYANAATYLNQVLLQKPDYLDAKLGLIQVKMAQMQLEQAALLIKEAAEQAPNDPAIKKVQADYKTLITQLPKPATNNLNLSSALQPIIIPPSLGLPSPLKEMQTLRAKGQLDKAIAIGRSYLKAQPKNLDSDVMLVIGLMLAQKKEYILSNYYLHEVLKRTPNYLDPQFGLIENALAQKQVKQAELLLKEVSKQAPNDARVKKLLASLNAAPAKKTYTLEELYKNGEMELAKQRALQVLAHNPADTNTRLILGRIYLSEKQYQPAKAQFTLVLNKNPSNKEARLALIDEEIVAGHDYFARRLVKQSLKLYPNDLDFLVRRSDIYLVQHMYPRSAYLAQKIIAAAPTSENAKTAAGINKSIEDLNPHYLYGVNEAGFNSELDYISDLKTKWQYSTFYFNRDTRWGLLSLNLNDATRFGVTANQFAINLLPVINKNFYLQLTGAYANQPLLFPTYMGGTEVFFSGLPLELSAGWLYASILPQIAYTRYTFSVSREWHKFWISFRPFFYEPKFGNNSNLYTGTLIRYLGLKDTFIKLTGGKGTSPDLANLTTIDFIVIKNTYGTLGVQFPIINHSLLLSIGADYQHWVFPNGLVRNISGGSIGLNYRFKDPAVKHKNNIHILA